MRLLFVRHRQTGRYAMGYPSGNATSFQAFENPRVAMKRGYHLARFRRRENADLFVQRLKESRGLACEVVAL